jgi:hypothetical protein
MSSEVYCSSCGRELIIYYDGRTPGKHLTHVVKKLFCEHCGIKKEEDVPINGKKFL